MEHRRLVEWPEGPRLLEHFRDLPEPLRIAGRPVEALLEVLMCRFADGWEVALDELPFAAVLSGAETVRAGEVVLSVPDGRSVTTLINATPIHGEDGAVVSTVVTMQDMAPLQELERMRMEFLGMVSHELRAPLTSIKDSTDVVLGAGRVFGPVEMREFFRLIDGQADPMIGLVADLLDTGLIDAGRLSVSPEPIDAGVLVERARNAFVSGGGRNAVLIDLPPDLPRVMADRQRIEQVLNNLLHNAARHSPGTSPVRVSAERAGIGRGATFTFTLPAAEEAGGPSGAAPVVTDDHRELSRIITAEEPRLVLLDLILPGTDGIELMETVPGLADLPVIFISAYGRDETIARALESGAADYIVKPFSPTELVARIRAALRRRAGPEPFVIGDMAIRHEQHPVTLAGREVRLTATEYNLLQALSSGAGRVLTYDTLQRRVWGESRAGRTARLRTVVKKLRRKLGDDPAAPSYILNVRGVGYRMAAPGGPE